MFQYKTKDFLPVEAKLAKMYWAAVRIAIEPYTCFGIRSRRPAKDAFNAALNYAYGLLYNVCETALIAAGLDAEVGLLHSDEYDKPVLAYDLIEAFRPWADRFILDLFLQKKLTNDCFEEKENNGVWLNKKGKGALIPYYNEFMYKKTYFRSRRVKRKDQINYLAIQLAQTIKNS